ncbi:MAG: aromatic amino acid transport family protein [Patescibacteria group bacterium]|nr:aromatic amino acid transport family protein [Patescibacteria group bacterium]MDD5172643.1 aromatic amino acid transport family protein [Patescibacteria group bacterium]
MTKEKIKSIIYAISVLSGTIIGVALFSLPYLTLQVGWLTMLLYFIILGGLIVLLHVLFGELVLQTPDQKRFPGIAEYYWGKRGKYLTLTTHLICLVCTILAYILVGGGFLYELLSIIIPNISLPLAILIFWALGALIIFLGSSALNKIQLVGIISFIFVMLGLAWLGRAEISMANVFARNGDNINWFMPYGILIFALWGMTLIPQIEDILGKNKQYMTRVVIASIILPIIVYILFTALVLGISGTGTEPLALTSLSNQLGKGAYSLILFFGLITTFTSFIAIGLIMAQVFEFDLKIRKIKSWTMTVSLPLLLYFAGIKNFLELIIFLGAVLLAIDGINMLLMYRHGLPQAKLWKRFASLILIIMLMGGIVYEIASLIN